MPAVWPRTMSELRQHLVRCAHPDVFSRCFVWIFGWFGGREFREIWKSLPQVRKDFERQIGIIDSMTPEERATPELISFDREHRIAEGAGVGLHEVRQLLQMYFTISQHGA